MTDQANSPRVTPVPEDVDVVVVGSGAGGMLAAIRAHDLGLKVVLIEKAHFFGGTSALSGGAVWIPNHGLDGHVDSDEQALTYLRAVTGGQALDERLQAFVANGKKMAAYLNDIGMQCITFKGMPDYFPEAEGSVPGRCLTVPEFDGGELGEEFTHMREPFHQATIFGRYATSAQETYAFAERKFGWQWTAAKMIARYWLDIEQRLKNRRDRRATRGGGLVARLRAQMSARSIPLLVNTALRRLETENGRVARVIAVRDENELPINVSRGVIIAAGGFEQNQDLRNSYLPVRTSARSSLSPVGANTGDALLAALEIGADTQFMDSLWWTPVLHLPLEGKNFDIPYSMTNDQRHPHSIMVNRLGDRFVNENVSYDQFGIAMVEDEKKTGANAPCWMLFDAQYRERYVCGGIMPNFIMPDRRIPDHWWDQYIYRASSISELAAKIGCPVERMTANVEAFNSGAREGIDPLFGRGQGAYDRHWGDPRIKPNPCLAPIDKAPFYAVRIDLGDLGSKGGLKADGFARVIDTSGEPIAGLYAVGNASACAFGNCYPGGGGTLGPALTFAYVAANHIGQANTP